MICVAAFRWTGEKGEPRENFTLVSLRLKNGPHNLNFSHAQALSWPIVLNANQRSKEVIRLKEKDESQKKMVDASMRCGEKEPKDASMWLKKIER